MFKLRSKFKPTGDQPQAIEKLAENLEKDAKDQVLLGVTGSGKTFTLANIIEKTQRPALIISHNKTLAAQLYQEFKEFFPENGVHYFVSYYDYYQPEAYIPQTDTYIEKDAKINQQIDELRHAAVQDLLTRKDIIVVASVSCIYNIGSPENYQKVSLEIRQGQKINRKRLLSHLVSLQYQRNDTAFEPGNFRVRGEAIEINLVTGEKTVKIELLGDEIERISENKNDYRKIGISKYNQVEKLKIFPATFWTTPEEKIKIAVENIQGEFQEQIKKLNQKNDLLAAQRLEQRTNYDLEMIESTGYCHGIENYSRHFEFRNPDDPPFALLDYYNKDFLCIIDESHMTIPQLNAMYNTDRARKKVLIEHGFRLPSALDNRPLSFAGFNKKIGQTIYVSATPGIYEMEKIRDSKSQTKNPLLVEQLIRPTGLLEPSIEIQPIKNQVKHLTEEIKKRAEKGQRTLAITLTKRLAEELAEYLKEQGIKACYLHSDIKTLERPAILQKLRKGEFDVIVGINLLREGLDLPEVTLIGILDADKEGFLRNKTTLIQTMGRAARHTEGHVILYADKETKSIRKAMEEIERRRKIQRDYNQKHGITPEPIVKEIRDWAFTKKEKQINSEFAVIKDIKLLEKEMKKAASKLNFERAAEIRDMIKRIKAL